MTEKEKFQRAFTPLHASPDTMTEVMKMTERKTKRPALRRAATIAAETVPAASRRIGVSDLRRAVVMSEILDKPKALRR